MEWRSIEMQRAEPTIDPESGRLVVRIELSPIPDDQWLELFRAAETPEAMRPPVVDAAGWISIEPPDDEIQAYLHHLQERIDAANSKRAEQYREQLSAWAERDRRIAAAQAVLDDLVDRK
jgi:hypothetical protein